MIHVYSEDYGYIVIGFEEQVSPKDKNNEEVLKFECSISECKISILNGFQDYSGFFTMAVDNAASIKTIDLSNFTIIPNNTFGMFYGCTGLQKIIGLSKLNTSQVTNMKMMFFGCSSLSEIDLSNFDTSLVRDMSYMFYDVYSEIINVTTFNTSLVEDMTSMFSKDQYTFKPDDYSKKEQKIIGLTNFDTSKVTCMYTMFSYSTGLKYLDLSSFNTSLVEIMAAMFLNCTNLISLDISNFYFNSNSQGFNYIFSGTNLKYINIYNVAFKNPDFTIFMLNYSLNDYINNGLMVCQKENIIKGDLVTNGCCLFDVVKLKCRNYLKVKYGNKTEYKNGFIYNDKGEQNIYRNNIDFILNGQDNVTSEENLVISAGSEIRIYLNENKESIEHFFDSEYDPNVESITFIEGSFLTSVNLTQTNSLFKGCISLKSINLAFKNNISLTRMDSMFSGCSALESIDFPSINISLVTNMDSLFSGCSLLKKINLSEMNASLITNMSHMFDGCSSLENIYLNNFETSKVVDMNSMFAGCSTLKAINIAHFKTTSLIDMSKMFYGCEKLGTINLSSFDTKLVKYMDKLFYNCSSLKILDIKNFDLANCESFNEAFTGMNNILYINLKNLKKGIKQENIFESLEKNEIFYICQTEIIIDNPYAYNCCEFMENPIVCNYTPPTTIINIPTTVIPPVITTLPKPIITTQIMNVPPIQTTYLKPMINNVPTTVPIKETPPMQSIIADIILLLLNEFKIINHVSTFYIHFTIRTPNYTLTIKITITVVLTPIVGLRRLEEKKIICTLQENGNSPIAKYLCEIPTDNLNIANIQLKNIDFNSQDNITLSITPIAKKYLNNIQDAKNQYDFLLDKQLYILEHCFMNRYKKKSLNISGIIQDPQPTLKNMDVVLMVNPISENDSITEINCTFTEINMKNYSLNCRIPADMESDFQCAISFSDDNNMFILYFDSANESIIEDTGMQGGIRYNINKNKGINSGAIIAIVLASIACIGALFAILILLRKKNEKPHSREDTNSSDLKLKV